jgi:hypothetical protein
MVFRSSSCYTCYALGNTYTGALTVNAIPYTDFKFIWPIPILETNSNPTLRAQKILGYFTLNYNILFIVVIKLRDSISQLFLYNYLFSGIVFQNGIQFIKF